jgi:DMSO/TMAO reductase YedYZ molybdopterin-dependent catalytic subunit
MGAIGNVKWTGTPLAPLLKDCEPLKRGIEVAFFGADTSKDELRKNEYTAHFSRGLHITDAMRDDILLCYEMNGEPLSVSHGAPVRLVVPGWFGIAWVKWLSRIEVLDRRIMSKYMARDYVTLRAEERGEAKLWRETSIGPMLVKSMTARALRLKDGTIRICGAAWGDGTPLARVEVKIDEGPWQNALLDRKNRSRYCWTFWTYDWKNPAPGEHTIVSRATDAEGRSQPPADDPVIKLKKTYWEANQQWPRRISLSA